MVMNIYEQISRCFDTFSVWERGRESCFPSGRWPQALMTQALAWWQLDLVPVNKNLICWRTWEKSTSRILMCLARKGRVLQWKHAVNFAFCYIPVLPFFNSGELERDSFAHRQQPRPRSNWYRWGVTVAPNCPSRRWDGVRPRCHLKLGRSGVVSEDLWDGKTCGKSRFRNVAKLWCLFENVLVVIQGAQVEQGDNPTSRTIESL